MFEESSWHGYEGQEQVDGEGVLGPPVTGQLDEVEEEDWEANYQGLPHFYAVDTGQDVDGVCTEHGQHTHVHKVENTFRSEGVKKILVTKQYGNWQKFNMANKTLSAKF